MYEDLWLFYLVWMKENERGWGLYIPGNKVMTYTVTPRERGLKVKLYIAILLSMHVIKL